MKIYDVILYLNSVKCNEIICFLLSVKLNKEIKGSSWPHWEHIFSVQLNRCYVLPKKPRNDWMLATHGCYFFLSDCSLRRKINLLFPDTVVRRSRPVTTVSGHTGRSLAWHSDGRTFAAHWVQQVLWFAARIALCNTWSSGGTALCKVGGATSQLDLPSLTPLSLAGCIRLN